MKTQSRENEAKSSANKKKCIFPSSFCPLLPFSVSSVRALPLPAIRAARPHPRIETRGGFAVEIFVPGSVYWSAAVHF